MLRIFGFRLRVCQTHQACVWPHRRRRSSVIGRQSCEAWSCRRHDRWPTLQPAAQRKIGAAVHAKRYAALPRGQRRSRSTARYCGHNESRKDRAEQVQGRIIATQIAGVVCYITTDITRSYRRRMFVSTQAVQRDHQAAFSLCLFGRERVASRQEPKRRFRQGSTTLEFVWTSRLGPKRIRKNSRSYATSSSMRRRSGIIGSSA